MPRPTRRRRRLVTLTTDIGWAYAAQMKAVLASRIGADRIVDLAHDLRPHAVVEGAFVFRAMAERFPPGTVHVCVIDPGVGGARAPLIVRCREGSCLVGPDNGVLVPLAERLGVDRVVRIDPMRVALRPRVGRTFDGRDLFAPAAAALARGQPISRLGTSWTLRRLDLPRPRVVTSGVVGEVLYVDRFGNLVTNIPSKLLRRGQTRLRVRFGHRRGVSVAWARSYEELGAGRLGLLDSSFGLIELSVARGSAAKHLDVTSGQELTVRWHSAPT